MGKLKYLGILALGTGMLIAGVYFGDKIKGYTSRISHDIETKVGEVEGKIKEYLIDDPCQIVDKVIKLEEKINASYDFHFSKIQSGQFDDCLKKTDVVIKRISNSVSNYLEPKQVGEEKDKQTIDQITDLSKDLSLEGKLTLTKKLTDDLYSSSLEKGKEILAYSFEKIPPLEKKKLISDFIENPNEEQIKYFCEIQQTVDYFDLIKKIWKLKELCK